jgi:outer membrane biosynthesis protein TonB
MTGSLLFHGAVVGLLLLRFGPEASSPTRLTIINAELLLDGMRSAASGRETASDADEEPVPPQNGAEPAPPAPEAVVVETPAPAPAPAPTPAPQPATVETPEAAAEAEPRVADTASESPLPAEPPTAEPAASETAAEAIAAADADAAAASAEEIPAEPVPTGTPIPDRERGMLTRRFSAWTGSLSVDQPEHSVAWKDDGQEYTAVFRRVAADGAMGMEQVVVEISTQQNGTKMSTEMRMARLAFSSFAQFVDRWDPEVQIHDDTIDGRFHSNTEINVSSVGATPVFTGKVTIAAHQINTGDSSAATRVGSFHPKRIFPGGVEMNVRRIALPTRLVPFSGEVAVEDAQVQRFERDARITFYADGTFGWQYVESAEPEQRQAIDARSHYLVGADRVALHIHGTVDGKVLVYTPERIVIEGDLQYANDPREDRDSDDFVGLVAERVVEIAPPEVTGPGDLEIDASIYARRQFAVREYRSRRSGTLVIHGSLAAGSLTATEPRYATRVEYDKRLEGARAPGFPLSDRYELETWDGEWRAEPVADDGA